MVAQNPNAPAKVVYSLALGPEENVQEAVQEHPNLHPG